MALCWLCGWCMDVISEISKDSIQNFLFSEGLGVSASSVLTDAQVIQCFADSFCMVLKKGDKLQINRFIAFAELLLLLNQLIDQLLLMCLMGSVFPLLHREFSENTLQTLLPPRLLSLFRYSLTLENYCL